jgi:predicted HTH transcriptional regulator
MLKITEICAKNLKKHPQNTSDQTYFTPHAFANIAFTCIKSKLMDYLTYTEKLKALKFLIEKGRIKTAKDIAKKLSISERTASRLVKHLKQSGTNVKYCRNKKCYKVI